MPIRDVYQPTRHSVVAIIAILKELKEVVDRINLRVTKAIESSAEEIQRLKEIWESLERNDGSLHQYVSGIRDYKIHEGAEGLWTHDEAHKMGRYDSIGSMPEAKLAQLIGEATEELASFLFSDVSADDYHSCPPLTVLDSVIRNFVPDSDTPTHSSPSYGLHELNYLASKLKGNLDRGGINTLLGDEDVEE
jgi:hypothetical protein